MHGRPDKTLQGILIISASVTALAFSDAIAKQLSLNLTIWQIFFLRSLFALPVLGVIFVLTGTAFRVYAPKWVLLRSVLLVLTWVCYYASFPFLSLSVAAVAIYTFPILVALFSTFLTDEPTSGRQWLGIMLGFVGVVVILQPGTDGFLWFTLLPVLGASFLAIAMILTRSKCQQESPLILSFSLLAVFLITGLIGIVVLTILPLSSQFQSASAFVFTGWGQMGLWEWGLMAFVGLMAVGIFSGIARAYQIAPPAIIAVFDYVYLLSATLWGFVFFAEKPGAVTLVGMGLIFFAGLLVAMPASKARVSK
ncbi:MAG: DMT family transporter [Rhodobacteraceae bacterium]|nr:DMT family transporter [Paracoccaceae bacterium]